VLTGNKKTIWSGYFLTTMVTIHFGWFAWLLTNSISPHNIILASVVIGLLIVAVEAARGPYGSPKTEMGLPWLYASDLPILVSVGCLAGAGSGLVYKGLFLQASFPFGILIAAMIWIGYRLLIARQDPLKRQQNTRETPNRQGENQIVITDSNKLQYWKAVIVEQSPGHEERPPSKAERRTPTIKFD
jgi:hypothetical protein